MSNPVTALVVLLGKAIAAAATRPLVERAARIAFPGFRRGVDAKIDGKLSEFAEALRHELSRVIERHGVDQESAKSFSTVQLLIRACRAVVEEQDEAKRTAYARLIARSVDRRWSGKYGRIEEALRTVIECSEDDFKVLGAVISVRRNSIRNQKFRKSRADPAIQELLGFDPIPIPELSAKRVANAAQIPLDRTLAHLDRLQRLGLVRLGPSISSSGPLSGRPIASSGMVTPLLKELSELLEVE